MSESLTENMSLTTKITFLALVLLVIAIGYLYYNMKQFKESVGTLFLKLQNMMDKASNEEPEGEIEVEETKDD